MRNFLKYFFTIVVFLLLIISCEKDEVETPDAIFYISNQITPINIHNVSVRFDMANNEIESINGDPVIKFPIRSTMPVTEETIIECGFYEDYLQYYNTKNNTSFEALSEDQYNIENATVIMRPGQTVSEDSIVIRISADVVPKNIELDFTEALPIGIKSINNNKDRISSNMNSMMILWNFEIIYNIISPNNDEFEGTQFNNNLTLKSDQIWGASLSNLTDGYTTGNSWYPYYSDTELEIFLEEEETLKGMVIYTLKGSWQLGNVRFTANINGVLKEIGEFNTSSETDVLYIRFTQPIKTDFISLDRMLTKDGRTMPDLTQIYLVK